MAFLLKWLMPLLLTILVYKKELHGQNGIVLGVEIDSLYRPVKYHMCEGNLTNYLAGKRFNVDAKDIIHIYRKEFPQQTRGIPPFNAVLNDLKQLDDYKEAELMAAKTAACSPIVYERNQNSVQGRFDVEEDVTGKGEFIQSVEPGMATVVPTGFNAKMLSPTHPNSGFDAFTKSVLKQIAASLGVSYAKMMKDYEAVNYSSLREGTLDEGAYWAEMQGFLIEAWKEIELKLFLESLAVHSAIDVDVEDLAKILDEHHWVCQKRGWFDPTKEIVSDKYAIELGLKSPIKILEEQGEDPQETLKSYALWKQMCSDYGLDFDKEDVEKQTLTSEETATDEDIANKAR